MQNIDRIFFLSASVLALSLLIFGIDGVATIPFLTFSLVVSALSIIVYLLFYQQVTTPWFYNVWIFNGLCIGLALFMEEQSMPLAFTVLLMVWLAIWASDYFLRQNRNGQDS